MNTIIKISLASLVFLTFFMPAVSFAADIFFETTKDTFDQHEPFLVRVLLDTKNVPINAIEGTVIFPSSFLELEEIREGDSSINFWIERPESKEDGEIHFSGITAGGITGEKRLIFSALFRTKGTGTSSFSFRSVALLKNDGLGTKITTKEIPLDFSISKNMSDIDVKDFAVTDTVPPEEFSPFIAEDPALFEGKHFLVFSAKDKGVGIDHYEVRESFFGIGGRYLRAESPYLIRDQSLKKNIYVKAVDREGNAKIVKIKTQNKLALLEQWFILGIILCVCIFVVKKIRSKFFR